MDGERYTVELEFKRVGGDLGIEQLTGKIKKAEKGFDAFKRGWSDLRSAISPVGDAIDGIARSAAGFAKMGLVVGGAAMFAGATYGVANLNNELEKATVGLGVIFNAAGMASSIPVGMEKAKDVIHQMRLDAQKLPGEFEELQNIFTMGANPAFRSGATIDQLRDLSTKAMVAGKVSMMDMGQVAREFTLLLEGRAGSHNTFGSKMGITGEHARKFNALDNEARFEELGKLLGKYEKGLGAFEATFDAASSTFVDNLKDFGRNTTAPLFESVKNTLNTANAWISENKQEITETATTIGYVIRDAYRDGEEAVKHWGPIVYDFAQAAYHRFHAIWYDAQPYVEQFAAAMETALRDPNGTIDKLADVLKLYAALKIGQGAFGLASGLGSAASGLGGMMQGAGLLGGGAAAASGAGAAAGAGALATAGAGAALIAALGGVTAAIYQWKLLSDEREDEHRKNMRAKAEAGEREIMEMAKRGDAEWMIQQRMNEMHDSFMAKGQNLAAEFLEVSLAAQQASGALFGFSRSDPGGRDSFWGDPSHDAPMKNLPFWLLGGNMNNKAAAAVKEVDRNPQHMKHKGGGGGTIQKVEIVITSNQNPSRIARATVNYIGRLARNPGASPDVRHFSALEDV